MIDRGFEHLYDPVLTVVGAIRDLDARCRRNSLQSLTRVCRKLARERIRSGQARILMGQIPRLRAPVGKADAARFLHEMQNAKHF